MKSLAAIPFAAVVAFGLGSSAHAFQLPSDYRAYQAEVTKGYQDAALDHVHDRCHGQASGTAHHTCGTRTGGPSGGLF